jgi:acyl-coenzyme A synthetase/AMP-(fatty) acid ligase
MSILGVSNLCFDISVLELLLPVVKGGTLVFLNENEANNPFQILQCIMRFQPSVMQLTPSRFRQLISIPAAYMYMNKITTLLLGGEVLDRNIAEYILKNLECSLYNLYGPTETTIWSTIKHVTSTYITVGKPIFNTNIMIKCNAMNSEDEMGEICIGGVGVSQYIDYSTPCRGIYQIGDNGLNGFYRTGDLGYLNNDREIVFCGRISEPIKLNGYRISVNEIENAIHKTGLVNAVGVVIRTKGTREYLQAYIVPGNGYEETIVRNALHMMLPAYMIPSIFSIIYQMPLNKNGKMDRTKLEEEVNMGKETHLAIYESSLETRICMLWETVLGVNQFNHSVSFFDLGGDSLAFFELLELILETEDVDLTTLPLESIITLDKMISQIREKSLKEVHNDL